MTDALGSKWLCPSLAYSSTTIQSIVNQVWDGWGDVYQFDGTPPERGKIMLYVEMTPYTWGFTAELNLNTDLGRWFD